MLLSWQMKHLRVIFRFIKDYIFQSHWDLYNINRPNDSLILTWPVRTGETHQTVKTVVSSHVSLWRTCALVQRETRCWEHEVCVSVCHRCTLTRIQRDVSLTCPPTNNMISMLIYFTTNIFTAQSTRTTSSCLGTSNSIKAVKLLECIFVNTQVKHTEN